MDLTFFAYMNFMAGQPDEISPERLTWSGEHPFSVEALSDGTAQAVMSDNGKRYVRPIARKNFVGEVDDAYDSLVCHDPY